MNLYSSTKGIFLFFSFGTRHVDARFSREKQKRKVVRTILDVKNHVGRKLGQIVNYVINIHWMKAGSTSTAIEKVTVTIKKSPYVEHDVC